MSEEHDLAFLHGLHKSNIVPFYDHGSGLRKNTSCRFQDEVNFHLHINELEWTHLLFLTIRILEMF